MFEKMKKRAEKRRLEREAREREEEARREEEKRREKERLMSLSEKEILVELYMTIKEMHGDVIDTYNLCGWIESKCNEIYDHVYYNS